MPAINYEHAHERKVAEPICDHRRNVHHWPRKGNKKRGGTSTKNGATDSRSNACALLSRLRGQTRTPSCKQQQRYGMDPSADTKT
jgi:hypothetical protein